MNTIRRKKHYYFLVEMIAALGLLVLLTLAFFVSLRTVQKMDRDFSNENRGLMVVDNTVERLKGKKRYTPAEVKKIFLNEFARSGLKAKAKMKPRCEIKSKIITMGIIKSNNKQLVEVKIKCY